MEILKGNLFLGLWVILTCCVFNSKGQVAYESTDYATVDDSFMVSQIGLLSIPGFDYTTSGNGVIWDYTGFQPISQRISKFTNPNRTGFFGAYLLSCNALCFNPCLSDCIANGGLTFLCPGICSADCNLNCLNDWATLFDLAELETDSLNLGITTLEDVYNFYDISSTALNQVAIGAKVSNFPIVLQYENNDRVLKFPFTYNDTDSSYSNFSLRLDSIPGTGINFAFIYNRSQIRQSHVEGYGTLKTPFGEFDNVLKIKSVIQTNDEVVFQGDTFSLSDLVPSQINPDEVVEYKWFSKDFGIPLLEVTAWRINGTMIYRELKYIDSLRCFDPFSFFGYLPLPVIIEDGMDSADVNFYNLSVNGDSLFWDFDDISSSNNNSSSQNPSHAYTEGGLYQVELVTCNTACQISTCSTTTIPVIVIDNRSTAVIESALTNDLQLRVYPNPTIGQLTIEFKCFEKQHLEIDIFDLAGKRIKQLVATQIEKGKYSETYALKGIAANLYIIRIKTDNFLAFEKVVKH